MARRTHVGLVAGDSFEAIWQGAALPWLRAAASSSWKAPLPPTVLVPSRNYAFFLKHRLLDAGISFAGLRFWTPADARAFLLARLPEHPGTIARHDLQLLLAAEAEQLGNPTSRAVARDPSSLVYALGRLAAAGWDWKALGSPSLEPLIAQVADRLRNAGLVAAEQADLRLAAQAGQLGHPIGPLLVIGFDGSHWDAWHLLTAAVTASTKSAICLLQPRVRSEDIDQAWLGSWEEFAGEAAPAEAEEAPPRPFSSLADRMETQVKLGSDTGGEVVFLVGYNVREEAQAIAAQAVAFLAHEDCTNLGILFPGYGALSREVASLLAGLGIACNDTLGYNAPAPTGEQAWTAWLAFQRNPGLDAFWKLARAIQPPAGIGGLESAVGRAFNEVLVDDLGVLAAFMRASPEEDLRAAADELSRFVLLPASATLADFLDATERAIAPLAWSGRIEAIRFAATRLAKLLPRAFSRDAWLAWLEETGRFAAWQRDPGAVHPFARVHLLTYTKADWQTWSHLILADLNEGGWPPPCDEAPFLGERTVARLNREAVGEGSQGEGHVAIRPGKSLLLGPAQRRAAIQRQFFSLLDSARAGLAAAGAVTDESDPAHRRIPSDFLSQLYFAQHGRPLSDDAMDAIRDRTLARVQASGLFAPRGTEAAGVAAAGQTRRAFDARRDEGQPFGEYDFALARPPAEPITIPCRDWENALRAPALVWMKRLLGVEERQLDPADKSRMALVLGIWIHRWLCEALSDVAGRFAPMPDAAAIAARLKRAAGQTRAQVEAAFAAAGRTAPEWWVAEWEDALRVAEEFAEAVGAVRGWPFVATELSLPRGTEAGLASGGKLRLAGRMDLVFAQQAEPGSKGSRFWVVDYKTGRPRRLPRPDALAKHLLRGEAVQLALYGLALSGGGANDVQLTLLTRDAEAEPQITGADAAACADFWEGLRRIQDTGIFGMRGPVRAEFGARSTCPLATLEINEDVLEARWALTHPLLAETQEEEE